ncbi:hypothetical protein MN546_18995 [Pseudomonas lundensis]|uniref:hypothetical protein n=1 Tax=Pseudomonas lundensis TaxID=86185 RepID=UPI000BA2682F|nr:hypothetical protein [Pseudomonas lundensis]MCT8954530.1 hypothetical protein [Pseudomonas lundensis]NNA30805.1 hypothetical protein [Pseudomonas lundensis]NNA35968.1 hypothetical protein [Pseudomonas lundensis]OZY49164.1 hypothetical protein CJF34_18865 [Pseudomonas lundensis]
MTPGAWKLTGVGLALVLLLVLGAAGGGRLAACHYRPLLDVANTDLATAKLARDNLETLAGEQGRKLGELVLAGELRERNAALAIAKAKEDARPDYAAANKLLRERTGGDPAQAASAIIDKELGL